MKHKPQIPDVMEAIFDAAYLIFDLVAAILFFIYSQGNIFYSLWNINIDSLRRRRFSPGAKNYQSNIRK